MTKRLLHFTVTIIFLATIFTSNATNGNYCLDKNGDPIKIIRKKSTLYLYCNNKIDFDMSSHKLNKSAIYELSQIAARLIQNPKLKIEIGVHNDTRSGVDYSKEITGKRANAIKEFFVNYGIKDENLIPKGFGDLVIINKCKVFVKCTNGEHAVNRRVELKIINPEELIDYTFVYKNKKTNN